MKLCSITIADGDREPIIQDALRSALPFVDAVMVVHLDKGAPDRIFDLACEASGGRLIYKELPFSQVIDARNYGLACAGLGGFDWAMQLDTDERILTNGADIRATLVKMPKDVQIVNVLDDKGHYTKFRFFRLPTSGAYYQGNHPRIHEDWWPEPVVAVMDRVRFHELPKSAERRAHDWKETQAGLIAQAMDEPDCPRWPYHLGVNFEEVDEFEKAIPCYGKALALTDRPDDYGWLCFRTAVCYYKQNSFTACLQWCLAGLQKATGMAELSMMAAHASLALGEIKNAISWARHCIASSEDRGRIGQRDIEAYFEAPHEILAECYAAMGHASKLNYEVAQVAKLIKQRIAFCERGQG